MSDVNTLKNAPEGKLGLIPLKSCNDIARKVDYYLAKWRRESEDEHLKNIPGYERDSYIIDVRNPRFGSGEAKGEIMSTVRGYDLYILVDVLNYSLTYSICGHENHMSPDDHYQDVKRIIAATGGRAKRITVIMPFLYESRQHKRAGRESLDSAMALQELEAMGVTNILTFDAHDPRVQNAIPTCGFESFRPTYQFVKGVLKNCDDIRIDPEHLMIISPDEGATDRAVFLANVLSVNMGMFYKRRDYTKVVDGKNPIVAHEYLGDSVEGKDVWIIDDMISSGDSILDVAGQLKKRNANRIFCLATFGLFTNGIEVFDRAYEEGIIYRVVTTNLTYQRPEYLEREYFINCDMSKFIAHIVDTLNHDETMSELMAPQDRIQRVVRQYNEKHGYVEV